MDPEGVHIYFDVYEAASYSEGFIDILLSDRVYKKQGELKEFGKIGKAKRTGVCNKVMNYRLWCSMGELLLKFDLG